MRSLILLLAITISAGVAAQNKSNVQEMTVGAEIVEKTFVNKGGKITDYKELYLRCSVQDYFIKLCESKVSKEELMKHLDKGVTVHVEIREGMWDHCDPNPAYAQSRTGLYAAILELKSSGAPDTSQIKGQKTKKQKKGKKRKSKTPH